MSYLNSKKCLSNSTFINLYCEDIIPVSYTHLDVYKRQELKYSTKEGYLFKSLSPYQKKLRLDVPFTINGVSKEFKKIEEYLNIPYPLGSHSLRKTWGKNVYDTTLNIALIMKAFNHSSPGITLKYIGIEEEDINKLYEGIEI